MTKMSFHISSVRSWTDLMQRAQVKLHLYHIILIPFHPFIYRFPENGKRRESNMTPKYLDITAQNPHHQEISHLIVLAHICINEIDSRLHANSCILHGLLGPNTKLFFWKKKESSVAKAKPLCSTFRRKNNNKINCRWIKLSSILTTKWNK